MSNWGSVALENIAEELKSIREILEKQSTTEGEWIKDKEQRHVELTYHCSKCGYGAWGEHEKTGFCGGCGAKMKG